jgi:hypothetical protein
MPNWCFQTLVISGEKEDLAPFVDKLISSWHICEHCPTNGQYELLNTFYPNPDDIYTGPFCFDDLEKFVFYDHKEDECGEYVAAWTNEKLERAKEKYGEKGWLWYYWNSRHWGSTKADFYTTVEEQDDTHIKITFVTAWNLIDVGIIHISNNYPLLTFSVEYHEELYNFPDGGFVIKGGEFLSQWEESKEVFERNQKSFDRR